MYDISYFKAAENKEVVDFMKAHPFIILCGVDGENRPVATHIPVLFEEREGKVFLLAHVMRKQDHSNAFAQNDKVLAIFYGPHTYVSASWYTNPKSASTWNYQAVHASGILRFLDQDKLLEVLVKLTEKFENDPDSPALVQKMDKSYVERMLQAIIAFEIELVSVRHIFKLSQNRDEKSYEQIIENLSGQDSESRSIADEMKKRMQGVFENKQQA